jgi:hypothetical protein
MFGLPRSHDSVSPASYASYPTTSSFEDSSSGRPTSSANSATNVIVHTQGMGHTPNSSVSTVTPRSPPIVATQQQQQQHVQTRQRPAMPTTVQAGPTRPQTAPKPPAHRPATETRRPRAQKRPRPSASQGVGDGGGSDDDSDDDDVVECAGPSAPGAPAGGAGLSGLAAQRK